MTHAGRRAGRAVALPIALVLSAALISGCTASRNGLSTHDSACFRVYPEAYAAVQHHGHFAGTRYMGPRALVVELPHVVVPAAISASFKMATCLVAFTGQFSVSNVEKGWSPGGGPGHIAIVIIRQRDLRLVSTVVLGRIPPRLVFAHIFPRLT